MLFTHTLLYLPLHEDRLCIYRCLCIYKEVDSSRRRGEYQQQPSVPSVHNCSKPVNLRQEIKTGNYVTAVGCKQGTWKFSDLQRTLTLLHFSADNEGREVTHSNAFYEVLRELLQRGENCAREEERKMTQVDTLKSVFKGNVDSKGKVCNLLRFRIALRFNIKCDWC